MNKTDKILRIISIIICSAVPALIMDTMQRNDIREAVVEEIENRSKTNEEKEDKGELD